MTDINTDLIYKINSIIIRLNKIERYIKKGTGPDEVPSEVQDKALKKTHSKVNSKARGKVDSKAHCNTPVKDKDPDLTNKLYYLEQKLKTLQKKIPKKKINKSVNNKDLEDIVEDIITGFEDIDNYLEPAGGIEQATEVFNDIVPPANQPEFLKLFLALIPVYIRWTSITSSYHKKTYDYLDVHMTANPTKTGIEIIAAKKEHSVTHKPVPKDLIPTLLLSLAAYYSVGNYKTLFTLLLKKFTIH